jgi:hypothetical protein
MGSKGLVRQKAIALRHHEDIVAVREEENLYCCA